MNLILKTMSVDSLNLSTVVARPTVMEESSAMQKYLHFPLLIIHMVRGNQHLPAGENTARDLRAQTGQRNHLMKNMEDKIAPTTSFTLLNPFYLKLVLKGVQDLRRFSFSEGWAAA